MTQFELIWSHTRAHRENHVLMIICVTAAINHNHQAENITSNLSSSFVTMTDIKLPQQCLPSGYQLFPLFLIHYHWRSTENISLSSFRHLVPVGRLRFLPVHLTCFCYASVRPRLLGCTCICGCGCAYCWEGRWAEGFYSRHTVARFFSAWQGRQSERRDDGSEVRGSARPADAHLRLTLEFWGWSLSEIFRGHKEERDKTCLSCHYADKC